MEQTKEYVSMQRARGVGSAGAAQQQRGCDAPREEDVDVAAPSLPEDPTLRTQRGEEARFCPALLHLV